MMQLPIIEPVAVCAGAGVFVGATVGVGEGVGVAVLITALSSVGASASPHSPVSRILRDRMARAAIPFISFRIGK